MEKGEFGTRKESSGITRSFPIPPTTPAVEGYCNAVEVIAFHDGIKKPRR